MVKSLTLLLLILSTNLSAVESLKKLPDPTRQDVIVAKPVVAEKKIEKKVKKAKKAKKRPKKKPFSSLYALQQILISDLRKFAVVNGKTVFKGDYISGAKVMKINSDNIVLLVNGIPRSLYLTARYDLKEVRR